MSEHEDGINAHAVDRYTSAHFGVGVTAAVAGLPWWATLIGSIAWELAEDRLKDAIPGVFPYSSHDTLLNASTDTLAVMAGWGMGRLALRATDLRDRAAMEAAVGATIGAVALPTASLVGHLVGAAPSTQRARVAYGLGSGLGGAIADFISTRRRYPGTPLPIVLAQAAVTGLSGALAGPAGAAVGAYLGAAASEAAAS